VRTRRKRKRPKAPTWYVVVEAWVRGIYTEWPLCQLWAIRGTSGTATGYESEEEAVDNAEGFPFWTRESLMRVFPSGPPRDHPPPWFTLAKRRTQWEKCPTLKLMREPVTVPLARPPVVKPEIKMAENVKIEEAVEAVAIQTGAYVEEEQAQRRRNAEVEAWWRGMAVEQKSVLYEERDLPESHNWDRGLSTR
jgi:hypothetical protein